MVLFLRQIDKSSQNLAGEILCAESVCHMLSICRQQRATALSLTLERQSAIPPPPIHYALRLHICRNVLVERRKFTIRVWRQFQRWEKYDLFAPFI